MKMMEGHRSHRSNWLRAAVLGANDGIISTASLVIGIASAHAGHANILMTGTAGLVAGAMSMAAGEYVSVSSQADTEAYDLKRESQELLGDINAECEELAQIYVKRGLTLNLARQVATQLMAFDALASHARDELGISDLTKARPTQAAVASAASFTVGALFPLTVAFMAPQDSIALTVFISSLIFLALLGGASARIGGANPFVGAGRVTFWGLLAMSVTAGVGLLVEKLM